MILKAKIKGLENIAILPEKAKRAAKKAIKFAGKEYYKQIHDDIDSGKSFKPRTGNLQQSITLRFEDYKAVIGTDKEYATFVEFGTRPHKIKARNTLALKKPYKEGFIFVKEVSYKGSKPYPFMFLNKEERLKQATDKAFEVFSKELKNA